MKFDDIFDKIGAFGPFQMYAFGLVSLFGCWSYLGVSAPFVVFPLEHWCHIPELSNLSAEQQRYVGIPQTEDGEYAKCERFDVDFSEFSQEELMMWNRSLRRLNSTTRCQQWEYDTSDYSSSAVNKFDLVCDQEWLVSFASTLYLLGALFGAFSCGVIADKFGRIPSTCLCNLMVALSGIMCAFAPHYAVFGVGRFIAGLGRIAVYALGVVMVMEFTGKQYRSSVALGYACMYVLGYCILPWMAKALQSDTWFQLAMTLPSLLYLSYYWLLPESPRWLLVNKKYDELERVLQWMAKWNRRELPKTFDVKDIEIDESAHKGNQISVYESMKAIFKSDVLRPRILVNFYVWFTIVLQYYAVSLNVAWLPGDIYLNTFLIAAMGFGQFPAIFITNWPPLGRRLTVVICLLGQGVCGFIALPLIKYSADSALIAVTLLGRVLLTAAFGVIYLYTPELFPTEVRGSVLGASSTIARISGMMAAFVGGPLSTVWWALPNLIYGVMGTSAGLLCLLFPETLGTKMPDTIEEADALRRGTVELPEVKKCPASPQDAINKIEGGPKTCNGETNQDCMREVNTRL